MDPHGPARHDDSASDPARLLDGQLGRLPLEAPLERLAPSPATRQDRQRQGTFDDNRRTLAESGRVTFREVEVALSPPAGDIGLRRHVDRFPFVPDDAERLAQDCYEAYNIQVSGLEQRLRAIGNPNVVIGVSGGLDSTHALIVAAKAMDRANSGASRA
mgnify:CR=1 FL=1